MGFAADAVRQQQWMNPGILFVNSGSAGSHRHGGYGTWPTPGLTPSSATSSSTGGPASRPLTPANDNHVSMDTTVGGDRGRAREESTGISGRATNKTGSPPRLPAVYRLSLWPDFTAKPDDNDISGGVDDKNDGGDLLGTRLGDSSPTLATAASLHDDKPGTSTYPQGRVSATDGSFSSFRLVTTASGSARTTIATTAEPGSPDRASMAGPTHMAVSARPLTAREYQRYRSQRRGSLSKAAGDKTAGEDHEGAAVGPSDMAQGRSGSACGKGPTAADGVASPETVASEKKLYRKPPNSSPAFLTKEEFEALPPAIQRKYFSTLEQLRLTQTPNVTIDSSQATNDFYDFSSTTLKLRKGRRSRIDSDQGAKLGVLGPAHGGSRTLSLDSAFRGPISRTVRSSPSLKRPAERNKALSIIIDTADEVDGKQGKSAPQAATRAPDDDDKVRGPACLVSSSSPTLASNMTTSRSNMTTGQEGAGAGAGTVPDSFMESFSFLQDAHDDLDLRLQLDAFDENSEATHPARSKQRPSFRKHLSISKINLSRAPQPSLSSRPGTKDRSATPASPPPSLSSPVSVGHGRRKSRALSLRGGNRSAAETVTSPVSSVAPIDPDAAHYQDPEARLKLRVYLASPQKFDEAIEFGFPSADADMTPPGRHNDEPHLLRKQQSCIALSNERTTPAQAVLADDKSSIYSDDDVSVPEPDSPKTPEPVEKPPTRAFRAASDAGGMTMKPPQHDYTTSTSNSHNLAHNLNRIHGGRGHAQTSSREMTLRMTLTRPDLRACDDHIYGWKSGGSAPGRDSPSPGQKEDGPGAPVVYVGDDNSKDSIERQFAEMDRWAEPERGVVRRFWNRVRRQ